MGKSVRHWVSFVAVVCVLLHAGLVVRHYNSVLVAALPNGLSFDLSAICGTFVPSDAATGLPAQKQNVSKCPICMGAAPAVTLADGNVPALVVPPLAGQEVAYIADAPAPHTFAALPQSRAPPATV